MDTPGHPDFFDEVCTSIRLCDSAILVIDVIEGVTQYCGKLIQLLVRENKPFVVVLNKMDRLILELRLPPEDAYQKCKSVLDEVNIALEQARHLNLSNKQESVSPLRNVVFASSKYSFLFDLETFAAIYLARQQAHHHLTSQFQKKGATTHSRGVANAEKLLDTERFVRFLWGNIHYDPASRKFGKVKSEDTERAFVHFVLNPLYKLFGKAMTADAADLERILKEDF